MPSLFGMEMIPPNQSVNLSIRDGPSFFGAFSLFLVEDLREGVSISSCSISCCMASGSERQPKRRRPRAVEQVGDLSVLSMVLVSP